MEETEGATYAFVLISLCPADLYDPDIENYGKDRTF